MSRELDRAIAEASGYTTEDIYKGFEFSKFKDGKYAGSVPRYSTQGSPMLELIEEMQKRNHFAAMDTREYTASFYNIDKADWVGTSKGKTLPEAVAKAAYRALTGEEWQDNPELLK